MVQESEGSRQMTFIVVWGTSEYSQRTGDKKTLYSKELLQLGYLISQDHHSSPTVGGPRGRPPDSTVSTLLHPGTSVYVR